MRRGARDITVRELADAFMAAYTGRDQGMCTRVAWWVDQLGDRPAFEITDADVDDLVGVLGTTEGRTWKGRGAEGQPLFKSRGLRSPATVNRYLTSLGSVYKWARRRRLTPRGFVSPTRGIERHPESPHRVRYLTDAERERLLKVCKASTWPKLYLLVVLALTTGARKGELLGLTWGDVDFKRGLAYVHTSKNGEPRVLPLTDTTVTELARHHRRTPTTLVFESPRAPGKAMCFESAFRKAVADARIEHFRFHDLRHTAASYLAQSGASLLEIADVLGHKQLAVVKRYAHLSVNSKVALVGRVLGAIK